MTVFRVDDVSINTDVEVLASLVSVIRSRCPDAVVWFAVSPFVHDLSKEPVHDRERVFPRILSAMSDHRVFFKVQRLGLPSAKILALSDKPTSHGLIHVDHRLLSRDVQELSILTSCSILGTDTFVPPFNKWNQDTASICKEHDLKFARFEDGWRHVRFNRYDPGHDLYYLHTHDTSAGWFKEWFDRS